MTFDVLVETGERFDVRPRVRCGLTADEFMIACEAGAFGDARIELVGGALVELPIRGSTHSMNVMESMRVLHDLAEAQPGLALTTNMGVQLGPDTVIGPDLTVFDREPLRRLATPAPAVHLVAEHSLDTRLYDLTRKAKLCAAGGVSEYWVLDDVAIRLHRFHTPVDGRYTRDLPLGADDSIAVQFAPGETVRVGDLFRAGT